MPAVGITGGIASGKSSCARALVARLPGSGLFDADALVRELLASDPLVRARIQETFGPGIFGCDPAQDRARLREQVFSDPAKRGGLEGIVHPVVRARWIEQAQVAKDQGGWLIVDIPLLFETGAEEYFGSIVVVACPTETQRRRLLTERGLTGEMSGKILGAQLETGEKINKADHLIWNDSTVEALEAQVALLARWLIKRYG